MTGARDLARVGDDSTEELACEEAAFIAGSMLAHTLKGR